MFETCIYGCAVHSDVQLLESNHDLKPEFPDLRPVYIEKSSSLDLSSLVHRYSVPVSHGRSVSARSDRNNRQLEQHQNWAFEIEDLLTFTGTGGSSKVFYQCDKRATEQHIGFWFVHVVLPYVLMAERDYCFLHAASVAVDNRSMIFLGESHSGKSTLANYFLTKGHDLISDDKVAIHHEDNRYLALSSHPYYRPFRQFENLGYHSEAYSQELNPLAAMFILQQAQDREINLQAIKGAEAFSSLMQRSIILFPGSWNTCLPILSGLARDIPIYHLQRPWGLDHLDEVYELLMGQVSLI